MGNQAVVRWTRGTNQSGSIDSKQFLHRNHLSEVVNSSQGFPFRSYNEPFGAGGSDQFMGQKDDSETGLHYSGARYFSPALARWSLADSITPKIFDPQSLNKYTYVRNDPVNLVDPDGRVPLPYCRWVETGEGEVCISEEAQDDGTEISSNLWYVGDSIDRWSNYYRLSDNTFDKFKDSKCGSGKMAGYLDAMKSKNKDLKFLTLQDTNISSMSMQVLSHLSGIPPQGFGGNFGTVGEWATAEKKNGGGGIGSKDMGIVRSSNGQLTDWVIVGQEFYALDFAYQDVVVFHELMHGVTNMSDQQLADFLDLGQLDPDSASVMITSWVKDCFGLPK